MFCLNNRDKKMNEIIHLSRLDKKEIAKIFVRAFHTEDGRKALHYLEYLTYHRAGTPQMSEAQLRHMEGQRSLVSTIRKLMRSI